MTYWPKYSPKSTNFFLKKDTATTWDRYCLENKENVQGSYLNVRKIRIHETLIPRSICLLWAKDARSTSSCATPTSAAPAPIPGVAPPALVVVALLLVLLLLMMMLPMSPI